MFGQDVNYRCKQYKKNSIQHYVIKFVSDLRHVDGYLHQ